MLARRKPLKRNTSPLKHSPIRRVSKKRETQLREYYNRREAYFTTHPLCEVWTREHGWELIPADPNCPEDVPKYRKQDFPSGRERVQIAGADWLVETLGAFGATEIHHTNKRRGEMLNDERYWLAVCRKNHERIESNKAWARREGFLLNF